MELFYRGGNMPLYMLTIYYTLKINEPIITEYYILITISKVYNISPVLAQL